MIEKYCSHFPVLKDEILQFLQPQKGQIFIDGTLGLAGHSSEILKKIKPCGHLFAFDLDQNNINLAQKVLQKISPNFTVFNQNFAYMSDFVPLTLQGKIDGVLLDIGLCMTHLKNSDRGFSFLSEEPLDMRFSQQQSLKASEVVNNFSEKEIIDILKNFGQEKEARKITKAIVEYRKKNLFQSSKQLAELIEKVKKSKKGKIHPATQTFQALRIFVNKELDSLQKGLKEALKIIKKNAKVAVISFHSLEDRIVKNIFRQAAKKCICPPLALKCQCERKAKFNILTKKPITPSKEEIAQNKASRSARLRIIEKIV